MTIDEGPVAMNIEFDQPVSELWKALTDPEAMRSWFFDNIPEFKTEIGFNTGFKVFSGGRIFDHQWKVTEVENEKYLAYNWRYEGFKGDAEVQFTLTDHGTESVLDFKIVVLEDFEEGIPEFERSACEEGWNYFLKGRLQDYMNELSGK